MTESSRFRTKLWGTLPQAKISNSFRRANLACENKGALPCRGPRIAPGPGPSKAEGQFLCWVRTAIKLFWIIIFESFHSLPSCSSQLQENFLNVMFHQHSSASLGHADKTMACMFLKCVMHTYIQD